MEVGGQLHVPVALFPDTTHPPIRWELCRPLTATQNRTIANMHLAPNSIKPSLVLPNWPLTFSCITELTSDLQVPPQISKAFLKQVQTQHTNPNQHTLFVLVTPISSVT